MQQNPNYCPRCSILFQMSLDPDRAYSVVLPPHNPACPKVVAQQPKPIYNPDVSPLWPHGPIG